MKQGKKELRHIGAIMDGNRRWAKAKVLEPHRGHDKGADTFGNLCDWCLEREIPYLTVYAFSTENWKRPEKEIKHIFDLMERYFIEKKNECIEKGIRISVIGERSRFRESTLSTIEEIEKLTKHESKLNVQIALSYGGRDEIVRATKKIVEAVSDGKLNPDSITEDTFAGYLDTAGIPKVDFVIRTGGAENRRLSNFLPWQTAYAELYFSDSLWPEFSEMEFDKAIKYYFSVTSNVGT